MNLICCMSDNQIHALNRFWKSQKINCLDYLALLNLFCYSVWNTLYTFNCLVLICQSYDTYLETILPHSNFVNRKRTSQYHVYNPLSTLLNKQSDNANFDQVNTNFRFHFFCLISKILHTINPFNPHTNQTRLKHYPSIRLNKSLLLLFGNFNFVH